MFFYLLFCVQVKEILQEEEDLSEIVQLVGKVFVILLSRFATSLPVNIGEFFNRIGGSFEGTSGQGSR